MTHKEFAAKWRATRRTRWGLVTAGLLMLLAPIAAAMYWLLSGLFFRMVDQEDFDSRIIHLWFILSLLHMFAVVMVFVLCAKRIFRRHGFFCPGCDGTFYAWNFTHVLSGGHCCFCGERVLEENPQPSASERT